MIKNSIVILVCAVLALLGCTDGGKRPAQHIPQASDTLYTGHAALMVYGEDPERALVIIDSARIVGNVSDFLADYLRAQVYALNMPAPQLDKAIAICDRLLQQDSTHVVDQATFNNRCNVLQLLKDANRRKNDDEQWLKYAIELADLNRAWGDETEALRMEADIAVVMARLGREVEGMNKIDQVIRELDSGAPSVDRMDASIVARKRKINMLEESGRFDAVIPEANAIVRKLEDFERRPSAYADDSFRLQNIREDLERYVNFYKAQARAFLARAYASKNPVERDEVRKYVRLVEQSDYGRTLSGRTMIVPAWKVLGEWDKVLSADAEMEARIGADTLSANFVTVLRDRADAATALGRPAEAVAYLNRYTAIQQELNRQLQESEAQEYAARYHAEEQDRIIQDTVAKSARKDVIIGAVIMLLLLTVAFSYYLSCQQRMINQKNHALARMISEQSQTREDAQPNAPAPNPELFQTIDRTIREEQLYTSVTLQRQDILDRFGISRRTLNDLLSAYAGGQSFTAYINAMRLHDAVRLLREETDLAISDIAEKTGFTPATLREQFKQNYGMTPTEYRQNL